LLAIEAPEQAIVPFVFTNWQTLCKRLRLRASRLKESDVLRAASILIFCGAVEQNLLGLSMRQNGSMRWLLSITCTDGEAKHER